MAGLIERMDRLVDGHSGLRAQIIGYSMAGIAQGVALAALIPILRDVADGEIGNAWRWLAAAAVAMGLYGAVVWLTANQGYRLVAGRIGGQLLRRIGEQVVALPLGWFHGRRAADVSVVARKTIVDVGHLVTLVIQQVILAMVTPLTVVAVVAFIEPLIALTLVVVIPFTAVVFGRIRRVAATPADSDREVTARLLEYAHAQRVLRASRRVDAGWEPLVATLDDDLRTTIEQLDREARPQRVFFALVSVAFAVVILVLAYQSQNGLAAADTIAVGILTVRFIEPVMMLAGFAVGVGLADRAVAEIADIVDASPLPVAEPQRHPDPSHPIAMEFDNVGFAYDTESVIRNLNLTVPTGSVTAIVGPSGSGKTTLTRLAARFYDADSGTVAVGGVDIRHVDPHELMGHLSMVLQDVYLFDTSIADNVRLARPDASDSEMDEAARMARLTDVIERLPEGWDARVGEGGTLLSAGERARVGIARALLKDAPILLLDEATAAIDAINEAALTDAISHLAGRRTILVIAHRLSTIANADQIAVVVDGSVEQFGTHAELLATGGTYARFWNERQRSAGWRIERHELGGRS